jgi:hypothetical protein
MALLTFHPNMNFKKHIASNNGFRASAVLAVLTLANTLTLGGLSAGNTYDLIVYSDWTWTGGGPLPVTQTARTGLAGTAYHPTFVIRHSSFVIQSRYLPL